MCVSHIARSQFRVFYQQTLDLRTLRLSSLVNCSGCCEFVRSLLYCNNYINTYNVSERVLFNYMVLRIFMETKVWENISIKPFFLKSHSKVFPCLPARIFTHKLWTFLILLMDDTCNCEVNFDYEVIYQKQAAVDAQYLRNLQIWKFVNLNKYRHKNEP